MTRDPYKYFRVEAREIMEELAHGVLLLEKGEPAPDLIARLFRLAHTLKGAARVVKQREIAEHSHAIEDVLAPIRDGKPATRAIVDDVLALLDKIRTHINALSAPDPAVVPAVPAVPAPPIATKPRAQPVPSSDEPLRGARADAEELDALVAGIGEVHAELSGVRRGVDSMRRLRDLVALIPDPEDARSRAFVGELRALSASAEQELRASIERGDRELGQLRQTAERMRLLPADLMFNALERAARDAAASVGKRVRLETKGGDARLDAGILGIAQRALVQAVRNAVAHGIEDEATRLAAGKQAEGRISIEIVRRGSRVTFVCRDDGRGIDLPALRSAMQRRDDASKAGALTDDDVLRALLKGGVSTSSTVTDVSGRGVGLDVVREAAEKVRGEVVLRTELHKGTTLEITAPLTLSGVDALLVEASGQTFAIPINAVRAAVRLVAADVGRDSGRDEIVVDGESIPFAPLARVVRATSSVVESRAWSGVIITSGSEVAALGVDRLIGAESVVVRPLPLLSHTDDTIAGAFFDVDGTPRLVLDPEIAIARARSLTFAPVKKRTRVPVLVIDDSITTRMLERSILESAGYDVDVASSGEEGIEKARLKRYALFLVDVEMPGMDGFTFVERTRADPVLGRTPAILVTSRAAPDDLARGERVGASAYIVKSEFDQRQLLERIRNLLR